MGVMSCSRNSCQEIMCRTYISSVGYICIDCKNEFKLFLQSKGFDPQTDKEIISKLKVFMETEKDSFEKGKEISVDEFFDRNSN